jgi:hypothetical protein
VQEGDFSTIVELCEGSTLDLEGEEVGVLGEGEGLHTKTSSPFAW